MMPINILHVIILLTTFLSGNEEVYQTCGVTLFPETESWTPIGKLPVISEVRFTEIKDQLVEAFQKSPLPISEKALQMKSYRCPMDKLLFSSSENFNEADINMDGFPDITYSSRSGFCGEQAAFVFWFGTASGYALNQSDVNYGEIISIQIKAEPKILSIAGGCCGHPIDTYNLGFTSNVTALKSLAIMSRLKIFTTRTKLDAFFNANALLIRTTPDIDDTYDESSSGYWEESIFGNILAEYSPGTAGRILDERVINGETWDLVMVDSNCDEWKYYDPFKVNVGWTNNLRK